MKLKTLIDALLALDKAKNALSVSSPVDARAWSDCLDAAYRLRVELSLLGIEVEIETETETEEKNDERAIEA